VAAGKGGAAAREKQDENSYGPAPKGIGLSEQISASRSYDVKKTNRQAKGLADKTGLGRRLTRRKALMESPRLRARDLSSSQKAASRLSEVLCPAKVTERFFNR
jgi:hypothetical protein